MISMRRSNSEKNILYIQEKIPCERRNLYFLIDFELEKNVSVKGSTTEPIRELVIMIHIL